MFVYTISGDYMYYLNIFFSFSIVGFILETCLIKGVFTSGILFGPWTPIYGIGSVVIILIYKFLDKRINSKILKIILLFLLSALILTFLEWCAGMLIELIFNKVFWNYENLKFNFGHYIALEISFIWGISSIVLIYLILPVIKKLIIKIPNLLTYILLIMFSVDLFLTLLFK